MKPFILISLLALAPQFAKAGVLAHFSTDQASYAVGNKAIIFVTYDHLPTKPNQGLYSVIRINDEAVPVVQLSDRMGVAISKAFTAPGTVSLDLDLYFENKAQQLEYDQSIAVNQLEINSLQDAFNKEQDADARALLQQRIDEDQQKIQYLNALKLSGRTLRELDHGEFVVTPSLKHFSAETVSFTTTLDRTDAQYQVGQRATLFAHVETDFLAMEKVLRADFDGIPLITLSNGTDYFVRTNTFASGAIGAHTFNLTYLIRPKTQADLLRSAKTNGMKQKYSYEQSRSGTQSAPLQYYYSMKINQLIGVISALDQQLESIWGAVESGSISINVTN